MNNNIEITETHRGFEVKFPYNPSIVNRIKTIKQAWWNSTAKVWVVPKHRERELDEFKKNMGVPVDPVIDLPEQSGVIPELPDLDIELNLKREPFPYQKKGIAQAIRFDGRTIIGDAPGLGKTAQAIGYTEAMKCKCVLVICPATLKNNWVQEFKINAGRRAMILGNKNVASWQNYYKVGMVDRFIVNFESLAKFFVKAGWKRDKNKELKVAHIPFRECIDLFDCVIIDEGHRIKDGNTTQAKLCIGIGMGKPHRLSLTGTAVVNQPFDLAPQLAFLGRLKDIVSHIPDTLTKDQKPSDPTGLSRFRNRYCNGKSKASNLSELNYRLSTTCFFRREKKDVLKDLPDKIRQVVLCDISNRAEYDKAESDFKTYLTQVMGCTDAEMKKKLRGQMMVKMGVLKQISSRGKLEAAKEYIDELVDSGNKVVVFIHHTEMCHNLKHMYPGSVTVVGENSQEERTNAIYKFQKCKQCGVKLDEHAGADHDHIPSDTNVIILNLKSGGVGITLTASSEVLLVEQPWTDADVEQAIDRTHRIGQVNKVRAGILLGKNTIDEYIYFNIILKKRDMSRLVNGDDDQGSDEILEGLFAFFNNRKEDE